MRLEPLEHLADDLLLRTAKAGLAALEELRHGRAGTPLDLVVEVEERPPDAQGDLGGERRLAGAHEADERNMPLESP
jgi:hypothetical protein